MLSQHVPHKQRQLSRGVLNMRFRNPLKLTVCMGVNFNNNMVDFKNTIDCNDSIIDFNDSPLAVHHGENENKKNGSERLRVRQDPGMEALPRVYGGTSLIRKRTPLGPYRRPMPSVQVWS